MKQLTTSAGRLFSATVAGAPVTVKDLMVSAPLYLASLESNFQDAEIFLACFNAREKERVDGEFSLTNQEGRLAARWKKAHIDADRDARKWLSDPTNKEFVVTVMSAPPYISAASPFTSSVE